MPGMPASDRGRLARKGISRQESSDASDRRFRDQKRRRLVPGRARLKLAAASRLARTNPNDSRSQYDKLRELALMNNSTRDREWAWHWVFPACSQYHDPRTGLRHRHHLHESVVQKAVRDATRMAGVAKPTTSPRIRRSFLLRPCCKSCSGTRM